MTYVRILVPLLGGDGDAPALGAAFGLAGLFGGQVEAAFVGAGAEAFVPLAAGITPAVVEGVYQAAEQDRARRRVTAEAALTASRRQAGTVASRWTEMADETAAIAAGRISDLVVFGRTGADLADDAVVLAEAMLFGTGRPLLLARPGTAQPRHVAIGWNDSATAVRAVAAALPLLQRAEQVDVVTIGEEATAGVQAAGLVTYLHAHQVAARPVTNSGVAAGETLLKVAQDRGADLLVTGGYSHSRVREFILGGITRDLLGSCPLPVLMAH